MTKTLTRTTFETSRLLDYFSVDGLRAQTGYEPRWWAEMAFEELTDNGIDAAESHGMTPKIRAVIDEQSLTVIDSGPGLPVQTLQGALDYSIRSSDKARYVSPTRGSQGNALKAVFAIPYVLDGSEGRVEVSTGGQGYEIVVRTDQIRQTPNPELLDGRPAFVKSGTGIRLHWPDSACSELSHQNSRFLQIARGFAVLNPHLHLEIDAPQGRMCFAPTTDGWEKWLPTFPTSPWWYSVEDLANLIAAYIAHDQTIGEAKGRGRTVREFVSEFSGLSGSAKPRAVLEAAGLSRGTPLAAIATDGELDLPLIARLLDAMQGNSRLIKPKALGLIGEPHLCQRFDELGARMGTFKYRPKLGTSNGLPYVLEVAFAYGGGDSDRELITGVNWSPSIWKVPFDGLGDEWTLNALLQEQRCGMREPLIMALHLAIPKVPWADRGKASVSLEGELAEAFIQTVEAATSKWCKLRKAEDRNQKRAERRQELLEKTARVTFRDVAENAIPTAYHKAAGRYEIANARQIMYAARGPMQEKTDRQLNDQYFTQMLLPDFITSHPELTKDWDVVYDARGRMVEPHTDREVPCGTVAVREYMNEVHSFQAPWLDSIVLPELYLCQGVETRGPMHRFGAVLFVEKEGFAPLFKAVKLAERFDLAIMSTKGVSVTAARNLVDDLAEYARKKLGHPLPLLLMLDFDKSGFTIRGTFTHASRRYEYRNELKIVDIGLRLADVKAMKLQSETVYVKGDDPRHNLLENGATEEEIAFLLSGPKDRKGVWGRRVELNSMTSDQFVSLVERKLIAAGVKKVIPSDDVLGAAYRQLYAESEFQRIFEEAGEEVIERARAAKVPGKLNRKMAAILKAEPHLPWDVALARIVAGAT